MKKRFVTLICLLFVLIASLVYLIPAMLPTEVMIRGQRRASPLLRRYSWPITLAISWFTRRHCDRFSDGHVGRYGLATWRTYARQNYQSFSVQLDGYASAIPNCAARPAATFELINRLLMWVGQSIVQDENLIANTTSDYLLTTMVSMSYLSDPVRNGSLALKTTARHDYLLDVTTDELDHFDGSIQIPTDDAVLEVNRLFLANLTLQLLTGDDARTVRTESTFDILFVPRRGLTIVSDVDDVLRVAKIWDWEEGLRSLFLRPFEPWLDMYEVYQQWQLALPQVHFHYASDVPEMSHGYYVQGIDRHFPTGTFSFRPMHYDSVRKLVKPRYLQLKQLLDQFPSRSFVLVGDTSTGSVLSAYARLEREYGDQVQCILLRDTAQTEPGDWIVPSLLQMPRNKTRMFVVPSDLHGSERHWQSLVEGTVSGCPDVGSALDDHLDSDLVSWIKTIWLGSSQYIRCLWLTVRPAPAYCGLDRPSLSYGR